MQKARALLRTEWTLKDALHMIQTNSDVPPNNGYQRDPREVITTMNRDRPGGHFSQISLYNGYSFNRAGKRGKHKKARQEQKKIIREAVEHHHADVYYDRLEEIAEWDNDGWDDYRDEYGGENDHEYIAALDDPWDDWGDYDYGHYDVYDDPEEDTGVKIGAILIDFKFGDISLHSAKQKIMDLL